MIGDTSLDFSAGSGGLLEFFLELQKKGLLPVDANGNVSLNDVFSGGQVSKDFIQAIPTDVLGELTGDVARSDYDAGQFEALADFAYNAANGNPTYGGGLNNASKDRYDKPQTGNYQTPNYNPNAYVGNLSDNPADTVREIASYDDIVSVPEEDPEKATLGPLDLFGWKSTPDDGSVVFGPNSPSAAGVFDSLWGDDYGAGPYANGNIGAFEGNVESLFESLQPQLMQDIYENLLNWTEEDTTAALEAQNSPPPTKSGSRPGGENYDRPVEEVLADLEIDAPVYNPTTPPTLPETEWPTLGEVMADVLPGSGVYIDLSQDVIDKIGRIFGTTEGGLGTGGPGGIEELGTLIASLPAGVWAAIQSLPENKLNDLKDAVNIDFGGSPADETKVQAGETDESARSDPGLTFDANGNPSSIKDENGNDIINPDFGIVGDIGGDDMDFGDDDLNVPEIESADPVRPNETGYGLNETIDIGVTDPIVVPDEVKAEPEGQVDIIPDLFDPPVIQAVPDETEIEPQGEVDVIPDIVEPPVVVEPPDVEPPVIDTPDDVEPPIEEPPATDVEPVIDPPIVDPVIDPPAEDPPDVILDPGGNMPDEGFDWEGLFSGILGGLGLSQAATAINEGSDFSNMLSGLLGDVGGTIIQNEISDAAADKMYEANQSNLLETKRQYDSNQKRLDPWVQQGLATMGYTSSTDANGNVTTSYDPSKNDLMAAGKNTPAYNDVKAGQSDVDMSGLKSLISPDAQKVGSGFEVDANGNPVIKTGNRAMRDISSSVDVDGPRVGGASGPEIGELQALTNKLNVDDLSSPNRDNLPSLDVNKRAVDSPNVGDVSVNENNPFADNDPGLEYLMKQGEKALSRSAAARGMLQSGDFAEELQEMGQGLAATRMSDLQRIYSARDQLDLAEDNQRFGQETTKGSFDNQLNRQDVDELQSLRQQLFGEGSTVFAEDLAKSKFDVDTQLSEFGMGTNVRNMLSSEDTKRFAQELGASEFEVQKLMTEFGQNLGLNQFDNQLNQQELSNSLAAGGQRFGQEDSGSKFDLTKELAEIENLFTKNNQLFSQNYQENNQLDAQTLNALQKLLQISEAGRGAAGSSAQPQMSALLAELRDQGGNIQGYEAANKSSRWLDLLENL